MIYADLFIMHTIARCVSVIPGAQWLSLPEEVQTFGKMMKAQLNLRNEAKNLKLFESRFAHRNLDGVLFPRVLEIYERESVLIEEYMNGVPINSFLKFRPSKYDYKVASQGLAGFLVYFFLLLILQKMLIIDNFVQ